MKSRLVIITLALAAATCWAVGIRGTAPIIVPTPYIWFKNWNTNGVAYGRALSEGSMSITGLTQNSGWGPLQLVSDEGNTCCKTDNNTNYTGFGFFYLPAVCSNFSASMWVKRHTTGFCSIFREIGGYRSGTYYDPAYPRIVVAFTQFDYTLLPGTYLPTNTWHHIAWSVQENGTGTVDSFTFLYDGVVLTNVLVKSSGFNSMYAGYYEENTERSSRDDWRIWTNTLTIDQLKAVYQQGRQ